MVSYPRRSDDFLSFKPDMDVVIYGKAVNLESPLAYVEVSSLVS